MNADHRPKTTTLLAVVAVLAMCVAGCATQDAFNRGKHAEAVKDFEAAMLNYKIALDKQPENIEFRLKFEQARYNAAFQHFESGRRAMEMDDFNTAKMEFTRVLEIDPTHTLAEQQLAKVNAIIAAKNSGAPPPEVQFDQMRQVTRTDPNAQSQLEP